LEDRRILQQKWFRAFAAQAECEKGKRGSTRKLGQVCRRLSFAARQGGAAISSAHAASPNAEIIRSTGIVGRNDAKSRMSRGRRVDAD
jgi:hypothetical protein